MHESEVLAAISPKLSHLIIDLIRSCEIGICNGRVKVADLTTSCSTVVAQQQRNCDRFKVIIPYAGQTLTWEVLFDINYPEEPPDFIFGSEDFCPDIEKIQGLIDWDYTEPSSLSRVIQELIHQYKRYQEKVISVSQRLNFEYSSLTNNTDTKLEDVEIHVLKAENRMGPINFLVKLHVDFARIPAYILKLDPGEDTALLLVTFNNAEGTRITPQLYLSPRVERALGGASNLRIPGFPIGSCLSEYVPDVTELLKNKVDQICVCYEKRKEYVAAFLSAFGRSILEYDAEVELPSYFPKDQPTITLQSIYHEYKGKPYSELHTDDYPYSPRWSGQEMAERARTFLLENIGAFQRQSVISCAT